MCTVSVVRAVVCSCGEDRLYGDYGLYGAVHCRLCRLCREARVQLCSRPGPPIILQCCWLSRFPWSIACSSLAPNLASHQFLFPCNWPCPPVPSYQKRTPHWFSTNFVHNMPIRYVAHLPTSHFYSLKYILPHAFFYWLFSDMLRLWQQEPIMGQCYLWNIHLYRLFRRPPVSWCSSFLCKVNFARYFVVMATIKIYATRRKWKCRKNMF